MDARKLQIINSAINTVTLYGYRRTSMEDIAREAGISRPLIYQHFRNKEEVVLAAMEMVIEQAFSQAELAQQELEKPKEKLTEFLSTYMIFYFKLVVSGPHSAELMDLKKQFGGQLHENAQVLLTARINQLLGLSEDHETGHILVASAEGIKLYSPDEIKLRQRISTLVEHLA